MLNDLLFRLLALLRRGTAERDLQDELEFHFANETGKLQSAGLSVAESRRQARLAVGGSAQIKEECRDAWGTGFIDATMRDIRYAVRVLLKSRGATIGIVLSLALGIGANTAVFTLLNALLLKSLPVERPKELFLIGHSGDSGFDMALNYRLKPHGFQDARTCGSNRD